MVFEKWGDPSYVLVCSEDAVIDRLLLPQTSVRPLGQASPPSWLHFLLQECPRQNDLSCRLKEDTALLL